MKKAFTVLGILAAAAIILFGFFFGKRGAILSAKAEFDFSQSPAMKGGRLMPLSSASADVLRFLSGKSSTKINGKYASSSEWLLYINAFFEAASNDKFFKTDNRELANILGTEGRYYSFADLSRCYQKIYKAAESSEQTPYNRACREALEKAMVFQIAANALAFKFEGLSPLQTYKDWEESSRFASAELAKNRAQNSRQNSPALRQMYEKLVALKELKERDDFFKDSNILLIPHHNQNEWTNPVGALLNLKLYKESQGTLNLYAKIVEDCAAQKIENSNIAQISVASKPSFRLEFENIFNRLDIFYRGAILYISSFVIFLAAIVFKKRILSRIAIPLLCAAFIAQGFGIFARMFIQMRPPVTNLYSSVIFAGWAAVGFGLFLSAKSRKTLYILAAAPIGFLSIVLALNLPYSGDTMGMMRAVLNSNFWLSVHIVPMMLGYCAVFLAGLAASFKLLSNAFLRGRYSMLSMLETANTIYGIICFAMVFSFAGTMLGGVWADMSWGRFWGWDPKENGALMVVLWCAFVVHLKVLKMANPRLILALACLGNIVAAWAWFGVNMLGVGLHSYGFMDSGKSWLAAFCIIQFLIATLSLIPPQNSKA